MTQREREKAAADYANAMMPGFDVEEYSPSPSTAIKRDEWFRLNAAHLSGQRARDEEVARLAERVRILDGALIKNPDNLHRISEGVERMGFGTRAALAHAPEKDEGPMTKEFLDHVDELTRPIREKKARMEHGPYEAHSAEDCDDPTCSHY